MNFSLLPYMVRGDLFTPSGKWKYTVQIDMSRVTWDNPNLHQAVLDAYNATPEQIRGVRDGITGYVLVVLEPYNKNGYPIMLDI